MMKKKVNKKILIIFSGIIFLAVSVSCAVYATGIMFSTVALAQTVVVFSTVGTQTWTVPAGVDSVEVLVVAGGGGGGGSTAGGGGGGGVIYNSNYTVTPGDITVTVGAGGLGSRRSDQGAANNTNGDNSAFGTLIAIGGGYGFSGYTAGSRVASNGGSGGGAGYYGGNNILISSPGSGTAGQGSDGGVVTANANWGGAGGGGAGGAGGSNTNPSSTRSGGIGRQYDISGVSKYYGGGGGGGVYASETESLGGLGGGGNGGSGNPTIAQSGVANTGGGGGGGGYYQYGPGGGAGGSGVVIIRYGGKKTQVSSIQKGLIGFWPLDGDNYNSGTGMVTDKTPYANHGVNNGATLTTDRMGQNNGAMSFDGVGNYINTNAGLSFKITDSFTMSAWVKNTVQNNHINSILSKMTYEYTFYTRDNTIGFNYWNSGGGDTISMVSAVSDVTQWHLATVTYDGSVGKLYIDGVLKATDNLCSGTLASRVETAKIGQGYAWGTSSGYLNGQVSDVRVYNRTLSVDEIGILFNSYKPKIVSDSLQKGLVFEMPLTSRWTKSEVIGSEILTDKTPYSNNGQNNGATIGSDSTSFDGVGNYISGTTVNTGNDFSVFAWVKPQTSTHGRNAVISNGYPYVADKGWLLSFQSNNSFFLSVGADNAYAQSNANVITNGIWNFIGATVTNGGASFQLYLNGKLISTSAGIQSARSLSYSNTILNIGRRNPEYFNGLMSSVKIYNRILSAEEINSLYDKGR